MTDKTKAVALQTKAPPISNIHVVAGTPAEMEQAQAELIAWADSKIAAEQAELAEAQENLDIAKRNKWRVEPWRRQVRKRAQNITFYGKVRAALEAGYCIVPPFPVEVFAIRTKKRRPRGRTTKYRHETFRQTAEKLPEGQGKWVSPLPKIWQHYHAWTDGQGEQQECYTYNPRDFQEVDFPFTVAKPQILEATAAAMKSAIFDQLGVLPRYSCGDPIVVGQILRPGQYKEPVTFFVAWWLDTADL